MFIILIISKIQIGTINTMDMQVYCINLPNATAKEQRMIQRFNTMGFSNVNFIKAASAASKLVEYYTKDMKDWYADIEYFEDKDQFRKDIGCFASHLLALRTFLASGQSECLICEDDIMFHNDFENLFKDIISNLPQNTGLLSLSYMVTTCKDTRGINQEYLYKCPLLLQTTAIPAENWTIEKQQEIMEKFNNDDIISEPITNKNDISHGIWHIDSELMWVGT